MINNIIKNIHLLSVFCVIFGLAVVVNAQTKYPKITHQTLEFNIDAQNLQTLKIIPIYSQKKKKLYELSVTTVSSDQKSAQVVQVLLNVASKSNRD